MKSRTYILNGRHQRRLGAVSFEGAAAAAGGAAGGAIGAQFGAAIGNVIAGIFGGGNKWDNAGPGVHEWFTAYGPSEFLEWMRARYPDKFDSVESCLALFYAWLFQTGRSLYWWATGPGDIRNPNFYKPGWTENIYATMGIDYNATKAGHTFAGGDGTVGYVFLPVGPDQVAADQVENIVNKVDNGEGITAAEEEAALDFVDPNADNGKKTDPLLVLGLGFVAAKALKII